MAACIEGPGFDVACNQYLADNGIFHRRIEGLQLFVWDVHRGLEICVRGDSDDEENDNETEDEIEEEIEEESDEDSNENSEE